MTTQSAREQAHAKLRAKGYTDDVPVDTCMEQAAKLVVLFALFGAALADMVLRLLA